MIKTFVVKRMNEDASRKRLKISLEPIQAPKIDFICPDGSVVELPPTYTDPVVLFARQVARLDTENQKKEKDQDSSANKQKDEPKPFVWKTAVDNLRDAAFQCRQLSSFLGLLSRCDTEKGKVEGSVMLSATSERYQYPPFCSLQGKIQHLNSARAGLINAVSRLQKHTLVDGNFIRSLKGLRENWNLSQIGRIHMMTIIVPPGPVGSLSVWIGLESPRTVGNDDCEGAVLRARDGRLSVRMPSAARPRALRIATGAHLVPTAQVAEDTVEAQNRESAAAASSVEVAGGGDLGAVEEQLLETLRSVVVGHVMRRVCKEAAAGAGEISAAEMSASKECVSTCHVIIRSVNRHADGDRSDAGGGPAGQGKAEMHTSAGERKALVASVRETESERRGDEEGRMLELVARRLLRCDQRHSHTPKQPQGGHVPRPLTYPTPLGATGLLPALDTLARCYLGQSYVSYNKGSGMQRLFAVAATALAVYTSSDGNPVCTLMYRLPSPEAK